MLITVIGLLNLYSATYNQSVERYFFRQSIWISVGLVIMALILFFDYRILERVSYLFHAATILLLVLVLFKGKAALGAQRWLQLGPISVQPSELVKITMALALAKYFQTRSGPISLWGLFWPAVLTMIPVALILKQPDLGTSIIVVFVSGAMVLFVGVKKKVILMALVCAVVTGPMVWQYGLRPYQKDRVYTFLNPEKDALGKGYQIIQSKIAVGSGQLTGKGFKKGSQTKLQFLPKQHTDFVFSNFAEEFGFLGSAFVLILYALFSILGLNVALTAKDRFGLMLGVGLTTLVISQVWVNLGMEIGLLPVVGVTLPLFSYGGTSILTTLLCVGILLNISMRRYVF